VLDPQPIPYIFNIYKPKNWTSFDMVRYLKKNIFKGNIKKIGHFGTLDPFAQGVLLVGINNATRMNDLIHGHWDKTYIATGVFGTKMDTGDIDGQVVNEDKSDFFQQLKKMDVEYIQNELNKKFLGEYMQAPHVYSAAKYNGKKLCEWAREGVEIKKEKKLRHITHIKVNKFNFPEIEIEFTVSSGTYIRTLFEDIAQHFGTFGYLKDLIRSEIGPANLTNTLDIHHLETLKDSSHWNNLQIPLEKLLTFPVIEMEKQTAQKIVFGQEVKLDIHLNSNAWAKYGDQTFSLLKSNGDVIKSQALLFNPLN
jgi:tRNA pseudouridine55 synthase